jgi:4-hydroxy-3-methylbut-2-enyl diphosphate reductase
VGAQNSSNSNRLRELAEKIGATAYLIADANCIQKSWLEGVEHIGVTAGASAPEVLVQGVVNRLKEWGAVSASERAGREENVEFAVPKELRVKQVV